MAKSPIFPGTIRNKITTVNNGTNTVWDGGTEGSRLDRLLVSTSSGAEVTIFISDGTAELPLETIAISAGAGTGTPATNILDDRRTWADGAMWVASGHSIIAKCKGSATFFANGGNY